MIAFGPVPSRRLGRSLGINNIPPKVCSYSCIYCQLGRTGAMQVERRPFYDPEFILQQVQDKVREARDVGESIDYLTFVPDGEPTLDVNLGREIDLLRPLGLKIAVITNASLVWRKDVRKDLIKADWVSLKVDAVEEKTWRRVNRPFGSLELTSILEGALKFADIHEGDLMTETMLVAGVNDSEGQLREVAGFLGRLQPSVAYLAIPTRPPAEKRVRPPDEETINRGYQVLNSRVDKAEYLIGYEGDAFASPGDVEKDLLSITSVHPMRQGAVSEFLARARADWAVVRDLIARGQLIEVEYDGNKFYMRRLKPTK